MYRGRVPGVYNSWQTCQEQVTCYIDNSFKGFKTRKEALDSNSKFLLKQKINIEVCRSPHFGVRGMKNFFMDVQYIVIVVLFY